VTADDTIESRIRRLILLRHGRTPWNALVRMQGHTDVQLDDCGRDQSEAAARVLALEEPVRLWTSDLARARETASYLEKETGLTAVTDSRLREFDVGARSGLTQAEFAERFPEEYAASAAGHPHPLVPGEEPVSAVSIRMVEAITECFAQLAAGETGILVGHGASLKVGLMAALGWDPAARQSLCGIDNCAWAILESEPAHPTPRLAGYNHRAKRCRPSEDPAMPDFASDEGVG